MIKNVFFDLDGTLTDPMHGITNCINYSLQKLERPTRPKAELIEFIGPPLRQSYPAILATDDEDLIEKATALYRERFSGIGIYENELYDGVAELLAELKMDLLRLFVVTSKPTIYSKRIIEHFGLSAYFDNVFGPELNGRFDDKTKLIEYILKDHNLSPSETIMVGDREADIIAGKLNGTQTIGVTYGYGTLEELLGCAPDHLCDNTAQILPIMRDYQSFLL
jgi:phosphoglycolate phosphatase